MLERGQRHPEKSSKILECFIVSSVAKDCLALSQYDLHHGSFLLVTPIVIYIKEPLLIVKALPIGGVLYSVSLVQSKARLCPPSLCQTMCGFLYSSICAL